MMQRRRRGFATIGVPSIGLLGGRSATAANPADVCTATKLVRAGTYDLCLLKATARAVKSGDVPDIAKCQAKFATAWTKAEARADGLCPPNGDPIAIAARVQDDVEAIVAALTPTSPPTTTTIPSGCGGGIYPGCGGTCGAGETCWANVGPGPTQTCACLPAVATACDATGGSVFVGPTCGGACPAGQVCSTLNINDITFAATCGCIPAGATPCISSSQPACGGACPTGQTCATDPLGLFSCVCQ